MKKKIRAFFRGLRNWIKERTLEGLEPMESELTRVLTKIQKDAYLACSDLNLEDSLKFQEDLAYRLRSQKRLWICEVQAHEFLTWKTLEELAESRRKELGFTESNP